MRGRLRASPRFWWNASLYGPPVILLQTLFLVPGWIAKLTVAMTILCLVIYAQRINISYRMGYHRGSLDRTLDQVKPLGERRLPGDVPPPWQQVDVEDLLGSEWRPRD